jgi:large subunit ribosomal protein L29
VIDIDKLRALSDAELDQALADAKRDLWQARFELATRQLKDYTAISGSRRTVARVLTVRAERKLVRKNA